MMNGLHTYAKLHGMDMSAKNHLKQPVADTWISIGVFLIAGSVFAAMVWVAI